MGYRTEILAPGNIYHVYNRGVDRADIFIDDTDRHRFIDGLIYYLPRSQPGGFMHHMRMRGIKHSDRRREILKQKPARGKGLVDLLCYCLMDNHIHLILQENIEHGTSTYIQQLLTSYVRYFNTKHDREGPLFRGRFQAKHIVSDESFLQVTRYVHLNPYVAGIIKTPFEYLWSSLAAYLKPAGQGIECCHSELLRSMLKPAQHRAFVEDYADYAKEQEEIKHLMFD